MWKHCWQLLGLLGSLLLLTGSLYARDLPEFTALVKQNSPAVVNISSTQKMLPHSLLPPELQSPDNEKLFDDWFKRYLEPGLGSGGSNPFDLDTDSRGSGFILSENGYIVTNHHVVTGADEVKVKLNDGRELLAKVVGSDERTDIALLKVQAEHLPTLKIGNSQKLQVGEWVLAIGSPFGFDHSATAGIVSAIGRSLPTDNYVPFIQTDVAINPGNSGGPLFNLAGEVVGINSQIYSRSGGFMGVSFSIPVDIAMHVVEQLKTTGKVSRGWIGVYIQEIDAGLAESLDMHKAEGALVVQVMPTGPASNLLAPGDVILSFDGKPLVNASALPPLVGNTAIGKSVEISILRRGKKEYAEITVAELPTERELKSEDKSTQPQPAPIAGLLGMQVSALDPATAETMKLANGGVRVDEVVGDPARKAGVAAGDVVTMLDGQPVSNPEQLKELINQLKIGKTVAMLVQRENGARFLALKIEANARE